MSPVAGGFLDNLEALVPRAKQPVPPRTNREVLPFLGGWFVYLGYEVAAEIEPRLQLPARATLHIPRSHCACETSPFTISSTGYGLRGLAGWRYGRALSA